MKTKRRLFACLLAVMLCMTAFSTTAFAGGGEDFCPTTEPAEEPAAPLTPEGNLTLIDDILQTDSEDAELENKQFVTVQSKAGNYFYLIIDRSGETENVYFLNLVDEADLLALTPQEETADICACADKCAVGAINTACPICQYNMSECAGKEAATEVSPALEVEPEPEPKPEKSGSNPMLVIFVVLLLASGGAVYFFKFRKKKPDTKGPVDLDDYDYGEDEAEDLPDGGDVVPEDDDE